MTYNAQFNFCFPYDLFKTSKNFISPERSILACKPFLRHPRQLFPPFGRMLHLDWVRIRTRLSKIMWQPFPDCLAVRFRTARSFRSACRFSGGVRNLKDSSNSSTDFGRNVSQAPSTPPFHLSLITLAAGANSTEKKAACFSKKASVSCRFCDSHLPVSRSQGYPALRCPL